MSEHIKDTLIPIKLEDEMQRSFISYAMAVIINRALPDVRDGLKPVHRRIIYDMHELGMTHDKPYKKSARIVGDVLGKYHPHGDTAVYDAMVRLAQPFSTRYMLVDGQGNFGSVDGDGAAAMRYTEARMSKICQHLIGEIDKDTVDFAPNFDESLLQPTVLPSRFPNLLVNGSNGIAVGMATNIPPHNLSEVIDGIIMLIENKDVEISELMKKIKGPDFPTGGLIQGKEGIKNAYQTGRGKIVVRAKSDIEPMEGNKSRIVVSEIPYMVNKANLIESIADHIKNKRLEGISAIRDESDRKGMRIVIELKRDTNPQLVLNYLYKHTKMQDTFGAIMLALVNGEPRVLNLKQMLYYYLEHQKEVVTRRTKYDLDKAQQRSHILEGLLKALDNIDEIIELIKASKDTSEAREGLMTKFDFTQVQAQAILDMRFARLTGMERDKLMLEYKDLQEKIAYYLSILNSEAKLLSIIEEELLAIKKQFGDARRSKIVKDESDIDIEDLIKEEDVVITLSKFGYIKRLPASTYRTQNRGGKGITASKHKEEDNADQIIITSSLDNMLFFTSKGRVYSLKAYQIPEASRIAKGMAVINLIPISADEKITALIPVSAVSEDSTLIMATKNAWIKRCNFSDFNNIRKSGLIAISLKEGDELVSALISNGESEILMGTRKAKVIRFNENDVRIIGRAGMGVRAMKLENDDYVIAAALVDESKSVLNVTSLGYAKRTLMKEYNCQSRGGKGVRAMKLNKKTGEIVAQIMVSDDDEIMPLSNNGSLIRLAAKDINLISRVTMGVRIMKLEEGQEIVGVAILNKEKEEE